MNTLQKSDFAFHIKLKGNASELRCWISGQKSVNCQVCLTKGSTPLAKLGANLEEDDVQSRLIRLSSIFMRLSICPSRPVEDWVLMHGDTPTNNHKFQ